MTPKVCYCVFYDNEEVSLNNLLIDRSVNNIHFPSRRVNQRTIRISHDDTHLIDMASEMTKR